MDEIIAKILASRALTLPDDASKELRRILTWMQTFTLAEFQRICGIHFRSNAASALNDKNYLKPVEEFLAEWVSIINDICELSRKINLVWKRMDCEIMGADTYMPILIRLMPEDAVILHLLLRKLNECPMTMTGGSLGYSLISLSGAVAYKLQSANFKKSPSCPTLHTTKLPPLRLVQSAPDFSSILLPNKKSAARRHESATDKYEKHANIVVNELKNFTLFEKHARLLTAYTAYLSYLETEIINKLSTENPVIYVKYSSMNKNDLISSVINDLRGNEQISAALNCLIEKHVCIQDFGFTLELTDRPMLNVLNLFAEKFAHHKAPLTKAPNKFSLSVKSVHSYYMLFKYTYDYTVDSLPISTSEKAFQAEANHLCAYLSSINQQPAAATAAAPSLK